MERGTASACERRAGGSVGPPWKALLPYIISFNRCLRYSEEGLLPCIIDPVSGKQGGNEQVSMTLQV